MKNKISKLIIAATIILPSIFLTISTPAYAATDNVCSNPKISTEIQEAAGCKSNGKIEKVISNIVSAIIGILGVIAVVFIVIGGIQYMTSAGDPNKAQKAKNTIFYALIGLAVAALAFAITQFAIKTINDSV